MTRLFLISMTLAGIYFQGHFGALSSTPTSFHQDVEGLRERIQYLQNQSKYRNLDNDAGLELVAQTEEIGQMEVSE